MNIPMRNGKETGGGEGKRGNEGRKGDEWKEGREVNKDSITSPRGISTLGGNLIAFYRIIVLISLDMKHNRQSRSLRCKN
jgi:hypothetical protein